LKAEVHELDKAMTVQRLRKGRRSSAPPGRRLNVGRKSVRPRRADRERKRAVLSLIAKRAAAGDSYAAIAQQLNNRDGWHNCYNLWTAHNVCQGKHWSG